MKSYDFYIVPTPIGNLRDITQRALDTLNLVDIIACEDIRVTQKLLNHFNIKTKCISYHKFNERERIDLFLKLLKESKKIALVSDAGTPLICDPGSVIVEELRKNNISVTALPGANAIITFLSQIAREDEKFTFIGFLPKTENQIKEIFEQHRYEDLVFYESPNRIIKTMEILKQIRPDAKVATGRELTKIYEEVITDNVVNILNYFESNVTKGEFVVLIFRDVKQNCNSDIEKKIKILKSKGFTSKDISVIIPEFYDVKKNKIYKMITNQ